MSRPVVRRARPAHARGVAFVLVLWVIAMLSILLGSFSLIARTENLQARHLFDTTQARYAAEAGLNLAVYELRKSDPAARWVGDGRPYTFGYGDAEIEVRITDDSGKIDINAADETMLANLFTARGVPLDKAQALADAVLDWRDPDDLARPNGAEIAEYKAAGLPYGPKNAPFDTVSELQQVLGMDYALYEQLEPSLTIYSGRGAPNAAFASAETLAAMYPDASPEQLQQLILQRQAMAPGDAAAAGIMLPDGTPLVAGGGGLTYSVKSRATLSNGASTTLDATIRMGGINTAGRPYVILRWRDGEAS
ncbi:MAG: general secretion pathway protein GspK [Rhodanobacteraceae bacterium]|jgi:general secretion pathway protein K|nr:general secretion pathway protein GspK [Rhodanobacteraceae bacterium]